MFTINHATETPLMTFFSQGMLKEFTKSLGLDPDLAREHQPIDPEELLRECVGVVETWQARNILKKQVTLKVSSQNFLCSVDGSVYLPWGTVPELESFTFTDSEGVEQDILAAPAEQGVFTLQRQYPAYLWSTKWSDLLVSPGSMPHDVTLTWTPGYEDIQELPSETWHAIRIYGRYYVDSRDTEMPIPESFKCFAEFHTLSNDRSQELIT